MKRRETSILVAWTFALCCLRTAGGQIICDHRAVDRLVEIPPDAIQAASELRLMFRHASVGGTIDMGLECLQGIRDNPAECTVFPDYTYDRRSWEFQPRGNSGWYAKVDDFVAETEGQIDQFDVFCFKYCYLDGLDGLMEPCGSPLNQVKVDQAWNYLRSNMESLEAAHPDKIFIWWTIPLTQVGQNCTEVLNGRIRTYVMEKKKILFDIADIECHDAVGLLHTNDQGWEIALQEFCGEQKPGAQACHPNWPGKIRLASAFWWLMARVAGWEESEGNGEFLRGDANADERLDISDAITLLFYLFTGGSFLSCEDAGDANDDGELDTTDVVSILKYLFLVQEPPLPPFSRCGPDPTDGDELTCRSFLPCGE